MEEEPQTRLPCTEPLFLSGRQVIGTGSEQRYAELAARVDRRGSPLPLLTGPSAASSDDAWQRLTRAVGDGAPTPDDPAAHWQGTVFVCDPGLGPVGAVLARATGRALLHGELAEAVELSRSTVVTALATPSDVTPELLAAIPADAGLGLLTARDTAAASALVVTTVLRGPAVAALGDLSFDTLTDDDPAPGRLTGVDATPASLRSAIGDGVAVLTGRGHARDCLVHLNGGGICGRGEERPLLAITPRIEASWAEQPTACQQSERCWRDDVTIDSHLRAREVRAAFVVLDSCQTAQVGAGSVRTDVSLPLALLDGNALAVACAVGNRTGSPHAGRLFQALVRSGLSLGETIREVNGAIAADPASLGRLALFGDAGLVPAPAPSPGGDGRSPWSRLALDERGGARVAAGPGAVLVDGADMLAQQPDGPLAVRRAAGDSCWVLTGAVDRRGGRIGAAPVTLGAGWADRVAPWIRRLRGLERMGLRPDLTVLDQAERRAITAVRARVEAADGPAAAKAVAAFDTAAGQLADLQFRLVDEETRWIARNFYAFTGAWPQPWVVGPQDGPVGCPQCGALAATAHRVRPAGGTGEEVFCLVCVRCGEVASGDVEFPAEVVVSGPPVVRGGEEFTLLVTVRAPAGRPVAVAVGASFQHEERLHCRIADATSFTLRPGERRTVEFRGDSDAEEAILDQQPVKILVAADGAVRCLTSTPRIRA